MMAKKSAGILLFRQTGETLEVLLVHPGGPFFKNKDNGAWSIVKGEFTEGEDPLAAARREFEEELGQTPPPLNSPGGYIALEPIIQQGGKTVYAFAIEGNVDTRAVRSNTFQLEWPPRSGRMAEFPEVDRAEWFDLDTARTKLNPAQLSFLAALRSQF